MKPKKKRWIYAALLLAAILAGGWLFNRGRPAPVPVKEKIMEGVTYRRIARYLPHSMIAHVLIFDRREANFQFIVTPADDVEGGALRARLTSQFLDEFDVLFAVNGDGFFPWWSRGPMDYYPHTGDPVTPNGLTASFGKIYADGLQDVRPEPTLYISRRGDLTFNYPPNKIYHAISGDRMLLQAGKIPAGLDDTQIEPRTAVGVSHNGRFVYLIVVDGRQPFYSAGATFLELAELLKELGAFYAMSLDGGGSSTMAMRGRNGEPVLLNSPIDNYIPMRERPVANHLGVYIQ
jgi:hypothetical protein